MLVSIIYQLKEIGDFLLMVEYDVEKVGVTNVSVLFDLAFLQQSTCSRF